MESKRRKTLYIVGAGFAGRALAADIRSKSGFGELVGFVDDDPDKIGTTVDGIRVYGPIDQAKRIVAERPADEAIIAMPNASRHALRRVFNALDGSKFSRIRLLPRMSQVLDGTPRVVQTREINPQDFLGREPVAINLRESLKYLRGKRVLISGAGGSIGSELSRQLLSGGAHRLYLFDHEENSLNEVEKELKILQTAGIGAAAAVVPVVGELKDADYMDFIMRRLRADVVFHCAAYKHVPMLEANPIEAVMNNAFGTRNIVEASVKHGVSRFVLISTDKAVDPVSIYGASKMLAEEIVLHASTNNMKAMVVRFGNVLQSRGSIVPLFSKQIESGGPVTVTHPEATRYFMTIPEAASLVLQAGGVGEGGTLYALDMGDPVVIRELAEQMIRFYGFVPDYDIPIHYIGLRPGEKLHEHLWSKDERPVRTEYPKIMRLERKPRFNGDLPTIMEDLKPICFYENGNEPTYRNRKALRHVIHRNIPSVEVVESEPEY